MNPDPFRVVRDFESALCDYTGAPFAVTTTSCTMALLLAVAWHLRRLDPQPSAIGNWDTTKLSHPYTIRVEARAVPQIGIPKRTYVSVPQSIIHAGGRPVFYDQDWRGMYRLEPLPVWDSARWLTGGMYQQPDDGPRVAKGSMFCLSFHWGKTLGIQQGGAILHDDPKADKWLRRARFDGRTEGVAPKDDHFDMIGWHAYMSPEIAAEGLVRLSHLPLHNDPLPNDDYPDLSLMDCFK